MESKPIGHPAEGLRPFLTVASQAEFAEAMRDRRLALGLTLADLDHAAGFHDGYAAHLENPFARSGRKSFKLSRMGVIWLDALGFDLGLRQRTETASASALGENADRPTIGSGKQHSILTR